MGAIGAYGVIVASFVYVTSENSRTLVVGLVTAAFWVAIISYFGWDYRKNHEKREAIKLPPLTSEKNKWVESHPKPTKIIKRKSINQLKLLIEFRPKSTKKAFATRIFFFTLEVIEASILIGFSISQWQVFTALSYQNVYVITFLIIGVLLASDAIRRLYHLKKFHSE